MENYRLQLLEAGARHDMASMQTLCGVMGQLQRRIDELQTKIRVEETQQHEEGAEDPLPF